MAIGTGEQAPEFDLEEAFGRPRVRLADFRGKRNVLLVFHPFAWTGVCEEEALDLQANLESFHNAETDVVFVSCDTSAARQAWKQEARHDLHVRVRLLAARCGGARVRRLRRDARRAGAGHVPDRQGRCRHLGAREGHRHPPHRDGAGVARGTRSGRVSRALHVESWGDAAARRVVYLHGVTGHGGHARELAERRLGGYRVLAPDLIGHGSSPYEPPWDIDEHVDAILASVGREPAAWIGHSFGGRLAFEIAAREPELVEKLVLLDPAIRVDPAMSLFVAETSRAERVYDSFEEGWTAASSRAPCIPRRESAKCRALSTKRRSSPSSNESSTRFRAVTRETKSGIAGSNNGIRWVQAARASRRDSGSQRSDLGCKTGRRTYEPIHAAGSRPTLARIASTCSSISQGSFVRRQPWPNQIGRQHVESSPSPGSASFLSRGRRAR